MLRLLRKAINVCKDRGHANTSESYLKQLSLDLQGGASRAHKRANFDNALPPIRLCIAEGDGVDKHWINDPVEVVAWHARPWCRQWGSQYGSTSLATLAQVRNHLAQSASPPSGGGVETLRWAAFVLVALRTSSASLSLPFLLSLFLCLCLSSLPLSIAKLSWFFQPRNCSGASLRHWDSAHRPPWRLGS